MEVQLLGSKIRLRELRLEDWPSIHDYARRPEACRYQPWGPNAPEETRAFVEAEVAAMEAIPRMHFPFAAALLSDDRAIGMGTIHITSARFGIGEISYIVHPDYWGNGAATEIARLLLQFGFTDLGLHRIQATCDPQNVGSARVLQKSGLTHEGRLRGTMLIRDGWRDSELYGILEPEWKETVSSFVSTPSR